MIVIFSGPSGVGKSTIINLLKSKIDFYFSISHTTRPMRDDEIDKEDYYFISEEAFKEKIETIKENYFPKTSINESVEESEPVAEKDIPAGMEAYVSAIARYTK